MRDGVVQACGSMWGHPRVVIVALDSKGACECVRITAPFGGRERTARRARVIVLLRGIPVIDVLTQQGGWPGQTGTELSCLLTSFEGLNSVLLTAGLAFGWASA